MRFQGVIDRVVRARDGAIEIHDFKTGARVPSQQDLDEDRQLALYQIGLARTPRTRPGPCGWSGTTCARAWCASRSAIRGSCCALESETLGLVERIAREREYAPVPGRLCAWCEYRDGCPASPLHRAERPAYATSLPPLAVARASRRRETVPSAQLALPLG